MAGVLIKGVPTRGLGLPPEKYKRQIKSITQKNQTPQKLYAIRVTAEWYDQVCERRNTDPFRNIGQNLDYAALVKFASQSPHMFVRVGETPKKLAEANVDCLDLPLCMGGTAPCGQTCDRGQQFTVNREAPASREWLERLRAQAKNGAYDCVVTDCGGSGPLLKLACGHHLHCSCAYEWFGRASHCPICREKVPTLCTPDAPRKNRNNKMSYTEIEDRVQRLLDGKHFVHVYATRVEFHTMEQTFERWWFDPSRPYLTELKRIVKGMWTQGKRKNGLYFMTIVFRVALRVGDASSNCYRFEIFGVQRHMENWEFMPPDVTASSFSYQLEEDEYQMIPSHECYVLP